VPVAGSVTRAVGTQREDGEPKGYRPRDDRRVGSGWAAAVPRRIMVRSGSNIRVSFVQSGRIHAALGAGRHNDAYEGAHDRRTLRPLARDRRGRNAASPALYTAKLYS
jgi:hypothetical protein